MSLVRQRDCDEASVTGGGLIMPSRRDHSRVDEAGTDEPRLVPVDVDGRRGTDRGAVGAKKGLFMPGAPLPPDE